MSKRIFTDITNNQYIGQNIGLKRGADNSPKPISKKSRSQICETLTIDRENVGKGNTKERKEEVTARILELRVRNITIQGDDSRASLEKVEKSSLCSSSKEVPKRPEYDFSNPVTYYKPPPDLPVYVEDFDKNQITDICSEPHYARDVFNYYREKEIQWKCTNYMSEQPEISKAMRAVLIDWLVEVQESFELNHETLYLAVKLVDHYLMKEKISKSRFQLLGATAVLIAAKFDERIPPAIDDFLYICDNAFTRKDVILLEMDVLKKLNFRIGYPLSYRFLRRYARCAKLSMEVLTLARYVLEMSLMEYEFIEDRDSLVAAAALLLALKMKEVNEGKWSSTLEYYSGYAEDKLIEKMYRMNEVISTPKPNLRTIRTKYSHKIFFEVAKVAPLPKRKCK